MSAAGIEAARLSFDGAELLKHVDLAGSKCNSAVVALQALFLKQQLAVEKPDIGSSNGLDLTSGTCSRGQLRVENGRAALDAQC